MTGRWLMMWQNSEEKCPVCGNKLLDLVHGKPPYCPCCHANVWGPEVYQVVKVNQKVFDEEEADCE